MSKEQYQKDGGVSFGHQSSGARSRVVFTVKKGSGFIDHAVLEASLVDDQYGSIVLKHDLSDDAVRALIELLETCI